MGYNIFRVVNKISYHMKEVFEKKGAKDPQATGRMKVPSAEMEIAVERAGLGGWIRECI